MKVADYIATELRKSGIRHVFGLPGAPSIPYITAFSNAGIDFVLTSNEAAAGIMADVSARLTGIPGVCHSTYGPGATNLATGIGGAFLDRSPVLAFTSEMNDEMLNRTAQMNINHQDLFRPITRGTFRLNPENAGEILSRSLKMCREEYPGPVHIGLPSDSAGKETSAGFRDEVSEISDPPINNTQEVERLLRNSARPVLVAGLTSARLFAGQMLNKFLRIHKIPVLLTPMAKGIIPEDHPCYAGVLFHALSDRLDSLIRSADLFIGLGYDPVEINYESWITGMPLIHFDTRAADMPSSINCVQFIGHPDSWFKILDSRDYTFSHAETGRLTEIRNEMDSVFTGMTNHFGPVTAVKVLSEELPSDSIITTDVGSHLHLLGQYWKTKGRNNIIMTNGWSGMGFGIPAAIAARLLRKDPIVACVTGDGGFLMMAGEIITARRYNLPIVFIVMSDGELNLIRLKKSRQNLSPDGTQLYSGDLFATDKFFGIRVIEADNENTMRLAVRESLRSPQPVIINATIDPSDYEKLVVIK